MAIDLNRTTSFLWKDLDVTIKLFIGGRSASSRT